MAEPEPYTIGTEDDIPLTWTLKREDIEPLLNWWGKLCGVTWVFRGSMATRGESNHDVDIAVDLTNTDQTKLLFFGKAVSESLQAQVDIGAWIGPDLLAYVLIFFPNGSVYQNIMIVPPRTKEGTKQCQGKLVFSDAGK